jgi:RNA polymerase sigma-70 factor (ECF subfamily)
MDAPDRRDPEVLLAHAGWIRALARSLVRDASAADDLVQDTWLAAFEHPLRSDGSLRAFLSAIARNFARSRAREESRREIREQVAARPEALPSALDTVERFALHRQIVEAVESLEEPYRTAILLRYFDDLPPREIARQLEVPVKTVNTRLTRALDQLRARLDRSHRGEPKAWIAALAPIARGDAPAPSSPIAQVAPSLGGVLMSTQVKLAIAAAVILATSSWWLMRSDGSRAREAEASAGSASLDHPTRRSSELDAGEELPSREPSLAVSALSDPSATARASEEDSLVLRGRVVDGQEQTIEGADVEVFSTPMRTFDYVGDFAAWTEKHRITAARTNEAGEFDFTLSSFGPFELNVRAEGRAEAVVTQAFTGQFVVVHALRPASLRGHVERKSDHAPVAGARVVVLNDAMLDAIFDGRTDAGGNYHVDALAPGECWIQVIPEIERDRRFDLVLTEGEAHLQDVVVDAGPSVTGEVRDKLTGRPIAGAEVSSWSFLQKTVRTDARGRYSISGVRSWRSQRLDARAPGYGKSETFIDTESNATSTADFELTPGRVMIGRIVARGGEPVGDAYVGAFGRETGVMNEALDMISTRTSVDGRFRLTDVRSDLGHVLFVRKEHFASLTIRVPREKSTDRELDVGDVVLPASSSLCGIVTDESGAVLRDVDLYLNCASSDAFIANSTTTMRTTSSDDRGRFRFADLAAGKYRLQFRRNELKPLKDVEVDLAEGEARRDFHVVIDVLLSITGRVLDPLGNGLVNALVWVSVGDPHDSFPRDDVAASTGADGSFKLSSLSPGVHALHVVPRGMWESSGERVELARANLTDVAAGSRDVVIQLARAAEIRGIVLNADGSAAARAGVVARDARGLEVDSAFADADGRFRVKVAEGATADLFAYLTRKDERTVSGYAMIENAEPRASALAVAPGTSEVVLRFTQ